MLICRVCSQSVQQNKTNSCRLNTNTEIVRKMADHTILNTYNQTCDEYERGVREIFLDFSEVLENMNRI